MRPRLPPSPYNGFKDDRERRRALNTRVRCRMLVALSVSLLSHPSGWAETLLWIKNHVR
jgi:hypothetical protein